MAGSAWERVKGSMAELRALGGASTLLGWDQETYMPARGGAARAEQLAALQGVLHERLTDPRLGDAIEAAAAEPRSDAERAALRALRFDRERAARVPGDLVRALALAQSHGVEAWKVARQRGAFAGFAPHLEGLVRLRREMADAWLPMIRDGAEV
ncbi:MAG TPA: carboxypeptidase M32, partial [Anaeromyxobacteraceae bacterium]|nr:carboxypeptidase M32 [Anaeromyxobacteraceae bacterium]